MNHKLLSALMCSVAIVACDKGSRNNQDPQPVNQGVSFIGQIEASSRATDNGFDTGDAISVFAIEKTTSNPSGVLQASNYADNARFTYKDGLFSAASVSDVIEQPTDGTPLFYKAVYPYSINVRNEFTFTVNSDQYTGNTYNKSDLLVAETVATTELKPQLTFNHKLSNILLEIKYEEKPAGTEKLYFNNVKTKTEVNLTKNTYTATGTTTNVRASSYGTNLFRIVLPPQTMEKGTQFITLEIGGKTYKYVAGDDYVWLSGIQYSYYVTVKKNGTITFTSNINPWRIEPEIEDVVPKDLVEKMSEKIPIYRGSNPPTIIGCYYIDPFETVYCEDEENGGFEAGHIVNSRIIRFMNQDKLNFTIDYESRTPNESSSEVGTSAFISGLCENFTVFFSTVGKTFTKKEQTVTTKRVLIISGKWMPSGIKDLYYAFVMLEKNGDTYDEIMDEGIYRVFKDSDGLSVNYTWSSTSAVPQTKADFSFSPYYDYIKTR